MAILGPVDAITYGLCATRTGTAAVAAHVLADPLQNVRQADTRLSRAMPRTEQRERRT